MASTVPRFCSPHHGRLPPDALQAARNHEAQTTPRRAADAAFQQAQAQAAAAAQQQEEQQLLLLHQQQAAAAAAQQQQQFGQQAAFKAPGAASPRVVNIDATTGVHALCSGCSAMRS